MDATTKLRLKGQMAQVQGQLMQGKAMAATLAPVIGHGPQGPVTVNLQSGMQAHMQGLSMQADAVEKLMVIVGQVIDAS